MIEYKVIIEALDGSPDLKKLGAENWEMCGILPGRHNGTAHTFYFKRPLQPSNAADAEIRCANCGEPVENYRGVSHYCSGDRTAD